ncbi:hypothetical protein H6CHR_02012 [Variovorax sp. PBL-H6]|nr:hypothetical protein H6CHR_02012 [Variovorax sp. PBL-H6]
MTESLYTFLAAGITAVARDAGANKTAGMPR